MTKTISLELSEAELKLLRKSLDYLCSRRILEKSAEFDNPKTVAENERPDPFRLKSKVHDAIVQMHIDEEK